MTKHEVKMLSIYGLGIIFLNFILRLMLSFLPTNLAYIIKTALLLALSYLLIHKRLGLNFSSPFHLSWLEKIKIAWPIILVDAFYIMAGIHGSLTAPQMIPQALLIALGAGFMEEYLFRGLLIKSVLKDKIRSFQQVWGTVLLSSFFFGLTHLGNALYQPLDATLFQVYYAMILGILFAAITLRMGNLWWTIILHFLIDFASITISQGTQAQAATSIWQFIIFLPILLYSIFLLRPRKIAQMGI